MTDDIDRAQAFDQMRRDLALGAVLADAAGLATPAADPDCENCGAEIPAARRQALPGATRCIPCQLAAERRQRRSRVGAV